MSETEEKKTSQLDFTYLAARLWMKKYILLTFLCIGIVFGVVWVKSTPKEYSASLSMMPEDNGKSGSTASQLARMLGVSTNNNSSDAISPMLYPEVISSIPFITGLFDVEVQTASSDTTYTLRNYIVNKIKKPWWKEISLPSFSTGNDEIADGYATVAKSDGEIVDPFHLNSEEMAIVYELRYRIWASVDKKTGEIQIGVNMQDPLVAAQLSDTVAARLQEYITDYRTAKARHDLDYAIEINEEAKKQYYEAQQVYADYLDRNQGLALYSAQTTRDRLQNEMQLAFNLYNQTSQKVQAAEAKVQDETPVFAIVNPATVPMYPSGPRSMRYMVMAVGGWLLLGICIVLYPALFGENFRLKLKELKDSAGEKGPSAISKLLDKIFRRRRNNTENPPADEYDDDYQYPEDEMTGDAEADDSYYVMDSDSNTDKDAPYKPKETSDDKG